MYQLLKDPNDSTKLSKMILRLTDKVCIPTDPANSDYQQYLKWVAQGNEPLPADEGVA